MARPSTGANLNIAQLEHILNERKSQLHHLYKKRRDIQKKLENVERQIERIGGSVDGKRSAGRVRNPQSLPDAMDAVLRQAGKPLNVGDIAERVQALGYRSNSANFRAIVNQTLIKERKRFQPSGERGSYQVRK